MGKSSLAVDIGASSGRIMHGYLEDGMLRLEEIHRFENKIVKKGDHFCWEIDKLFLEIKAGIQKCTQLGITPTSIGIDTWAVDFVLLDENDELLTEAVAYRDPRTDGMMEEVFKHIPKEQLYLRTGIQFQKFNTIYQLYSLKKNKPELLKKAKTFLMIPDYLHFLLTGVKANEYTNATSTQLVNATTKEWDWELIGLLGINNEMFQEIKTPKTILGNFKEELVEELGLDMTVILPATHDTASAVIAVPEVERTIYLSSGTWSLMGVENNKPMNTLDALNYNFTNEGGIDYRYRFLKNIMGLWMIQEVKRHLGDQFSFSELVDVARQSEDFSSVVDVDDQRFLNPENMIEVIQAYCAETNQTIPQTPGELGKCIFESLVISYEATIKQLEELDGHSYARVNVIGGGCQNDLLNQLIADRTRKEVYAGPVEATAIGNIVAQLLALKEIGNLNDARVLINNSFAIQKYTSLIEER